MLLWTKYIRMHIKSQMQYRTSFLLLCIGQFLTPFSLFAGLYLMFRRFGTLRGYSFYEVALCFAITNMSFAITEMAVRGFDTFATQIRTATFDRLLLRPRNLVLQVLGSEFSLMRTGRLLQSGIVLGIAIAGAGIAWTPIRAAVLLSMIVSGALVFAGVFVLVSTFAFWTIQGIEIANVFTDGGREASQYPLDIYRTPFRLFFTYIIPFGMANYIPLRFIMGKAGISPLSALAPLYALAFIVPCVAFWYFGVRHYKSSGS